MGVTPGSTGIQSVPNSELEFIMIQLDNVCHSPSDKKCLDLINQEITLRIVFLQY